MPTSLVTGGAGFLGSHVASHLLDMGHKVIILDDLSGGFVENLPSGFQILGSNPVKWYNEPEGTLITADCLFVHGSILDEHLVDHLVAMYKPDYIYHLAAYAAESLSHHVRRFNYENNLIGSVNLVNAAINAGTVKRFVFTSSAAVYGHMREVATEGVRPEPADPYGIAKYAVEMDLYNARGVFGLPFTIFRCHNIYGERQNLNDAHRNAVGIFMRQCLQGKPMTIFGNGMQTRQFTYIDDVVPHLARCIEMTNTEDRVFNIGSNTPTSIGALADKVARALSVKAVIEHLPARPEVQHVWVHHGNFQMTFEASTTTPLDDGLAKMAAWARTQPLHEPRPFAAIEVEQGLPEAWRGYVRD